MFFSLVFHNHQPVGQLPWAFEDAWRDSYEPFLDVLEKHPNVRVALHYTGALLEWLHENKPATIQRVRELAQRGQIEVLGGGFYEPILAIWPEADRLEQIRRLRQRVEQLFGVAPRGLWLAERVWEPQLARTLCASNIDYTFVDGTVFEAAGIDEKDSFHPYSVISPSHEYSCGATSSDNDRKLAVFPINQPLRLSIPWKPVAGSIDYLRQVAAHSDAESIVVFADDGEKFGAWPGTYDWVFAQGWLDAFFGALEENSSWIQTITPRDYLQSHPPREFVDLPAGSYSEMQAWAGGDWRNFLHRYHESRDIRDEVLRARAEVERASDQNKVVAFATVASAIISGATISNEISPQRLEQAREHILRAQSNDAYWHGVFGGLYLRHLRQALYSEAASAQALMQGDAPFARIETATPTNAAREGAAREGAAETEIFLRNESQKIGWRAAGGHAFLWTSFGARHNILSTLRRYRESYHDENSPLDWHPRGALLDHFFGANATPELFAKSRCPEEGDFITEPWDLQTREEENAVSLLARREGHVWTNGVHRPVRIEKTVTLRAGSSELNVAYRFFNPSDEVLDVWWGNEWNVALSGADLPERHYHADDHATRHDLNQIAQFEAVSNPIVADRWLGLWVEWNFDEPIAMWHVPINTISQKEGGAIETTHQSSAFVFHQRLRLAPRHEYSCAFTTTVTAKPR